MGELTVIHGDALEKLKELPDNSVHCMVTSPPYYGVRDYQAAGQLGLEATVDEYLARMVAIFREARRVLHPMGTLWLNLGDSYSNETVRPRIGGTLNQWKDGGRRKPEAIPDGSKGKTGLPPKNLIGIPWRVALALQADGWWLRSDIIWHKRNPMPGSQRDRPTTAHEYLFLLTKSPRYFYDEERIAEPVSGTANARGSGVNPKAKGWKSPDGWDRSKGIGGHGTIHRAGRTKQNSSFSAAVTQVVSKRKKRSVWSLATQPYKAAHFATFPPKLIEPCIRAGTSEVGCCPKCLTPWERITGRGEPDLAWQRQCGGDRNGQYSGQATKDYALAGAQDASATKARILAGMVERVTIGWRKRCRCHYQTPIRCRVLDMFAGSGTTGEVALAHDCDATLIELATHYLPLIFDRCRPAPAAAPTPQRRIQRLAPMKAFDFTTTAPREFAAMTGSVSFKLEPIVARRIGAGGRCGASNNNPTNMLYMPSMNTETARMTTTTPEARIHDTAQPEILAALAREARWWKYSSCEHVFHCIRLWDCWVGVAGDGDNGAYEYFVWKDGKLTTSNVGYGCTDTALRDVLKEVVQ